MKNKKINQGKRPGKSASCRLFPRELAMIYYHTYLFIKFENRTPKNINTIIYLDNNLVPFWLGKVFHYFTGNMLSFRSMRHFVGMGAEGGRRMLEWNHSAGRIRKMDFFFFFTGVPKKLPQDFQKKENVNYF